MGSGWRSRGHDGLLLLVLMYTRSTVVAHTTTRAQAVNTTVTTFPPLCCGVTESNGLENIDIVAIVLGCVLFCVIILIIVLCVLLKKGYIGRAAEKQVRVIPVLSNFSVTADSLQDCSFGAICGTRKPKSRRHRQNTEPANQADPIIYMYDDIYYPPKSRPLPNGNIHAERYPECVKPVKQPKPRHQRTHDNMPIRKYRAPTKQHIPEPEMNGNCVAIPSTGRLSITTNYTARAPYTDWI